MATTNNRTKKVLSPILNGITAGGTIEIALQYGWDQTIESAADGLETPLRDKSGQFLRGTFQSTDWSLIISILTGTLDELVFSVRDSGVDEATGYTEHTIVNPVVHNVSLSIRKDQHATITAAFECRFASEVATLLDVWSQSAGQSKPDTAVPAVGGHRILTTTFTPASGSAINIYHVTDFNFNLALQLSRECNDGDLGYTCVDAFYDGMTVGGSLGFQDNFLATGTLGQRLILANAGVLVLSVKQGQGDAAKTVTINGVDWGTASHTAANNNNYNPNSLDFGIANDPDAPYTLLTAPKLITIA